MKDQGMEDFMWIEENGSSYPEEPVRESDGHIYEIVVQGCIDPEIWADWFGEMKYAINQGMDQVTLRGHIIDQADLYGLFARLRDRGLTLIAVSKIENKS